jgi:choline dehydrogenase-like flavoprotein
MYQDFDTYTENTFSTDICIVGTGAAGFACAVSLLNSGLKVLVLEGGSKKYNEAAADLHRANVVNHPHTGIHDARERVIGGTTTKWGGQALPFMREDFEIRDHVPNSGWPLSLQDLLPYYKKAEEVLGTDSTVPFEYDPWKDWKIEKPDFDSKKVSLLITKWCKIPNFAIQHNHKISASANVILLSNANVLEILPGDNLSKVKSLRIASLKGKQGTVEAKYFIAAGGAIETVRLFLNSKKFGEKGLGNNGGLVGKFFQDHVAAIVGQIKPFSRERLKSVFDPFYKNGFKYFPRIKLNPETASDKKILHASGQIVFVDDDESVLGHAKSIMADLKQKKLPRFNKIKHLLNPFGIVEVIKGGIRWKFKNRGSSPKHGPIWLEVHSEQEPSDTSYIMLDEAVDAFGMPRVRFHWTISDLTLETIRQTAQIIKQEFKKNNLGQIELEQWVKGNSFDPKIWLSDVFHQAGGLRMANNPNEGVVDTSCKVFGVSNLYVASSAIFPTSSFSNPTMTTIAIAIRICDTIVVKGK